jgi:SNF2 family DNA or RNA helicase
MDDVEREFYHRVIEFCQSIYQRYAKGRISLGWDAQQVNIFTLLLVSLLKQNSSSPQSVTKTLEEKILPKLEEDYEKSVCNRLIQLGGTINVPTKARTLLDILKEQDDRSIVYSEYIPTLFMLKKFLESQGMEVILYYGGMNAAEKDAAVKKFRDTEKAIFLSSESGGQGLNLQFCHQLINYDLPWNPMRIEQRIGRVHRFGQTETVDIYMTPVKGTIDDYLLYILTSKINLFELVIGELDTIMSYALDNDYSLEVTIGKIMLESIDSSDMEAKLRQIGEDLLKAKTQYIADTKDSAKLLDEIGADNNE